MPDDLCAGDVTLDSYLLVSVLPLEMIDVASIDQVHAIDEELRSPHGFEEVPRPFHLR